MGADCGERFLDDPRLGHGWRSEEQVETCDGKEASMFAERNQNVKCFIYPSTYL